ncbi:MAG: signal peptide peptidase SppA [Gemmatimonadota bacterium]
MADNRRTTVLSLVLLLALFGVGAVLSARLIVGDGIPTFSDRVAVLPVEGTIASEEPVLEALEAFRSDRSVRAFVLEIDSPGGAVGASQAIFRALRELRDSEDRPIVAWMGDVAASGGYYVALAADSIFALPGSITGSIGVIMEFPNAEELLRKVGIGWEVVKSGEHKDMGSPAHPLAPEDREILEGVVRDVHEQFVEAVAENRPLDRQTVAALADGRIFSGRQAVELRLIDRIGTLDDAIDAAGRMAGIGEDPPTTRPQEPRIGLFDLIFGVSESQARRLLTNVLPAPGGPPRLRYEWK